MRENFESLILETIEASRLPKKKKQELQKELFTHFFDEQRELQLEGYGEQKIFETVQERFGNTQKLGEELSLIHTSMSLKKIMLIGVIFWIVLTTVAFSMDGMGLFSTQSCKVLGYGSCITTHITLVFAGSPLISVASVAINPFAHIFILIHIILIIGLYKLFSSKVLKALRQRINFKQALQFTIATAVNLLWSSILLSYTRLPSNMDFDRNLPVDQWPPFAVAGFPFNVFEYPVPPMGTDLAPLTMWPRFYLNYAFWLVVAIVIFKLLPPRITSNKKVLTVLMTCASIITVFSMGYLMLQFD